MKRKDVNENEEDVRTAPKHWNQAKARFGLTPEELAMAKEAGFNPVSMDVSARGRKIRRRSLDTLPLRATAAQTKKVKHEIRERYAWLFGEVPLPPVEAPRAKKSDGAQYESDSITELTATIPTDLRQQVALGCVRRGLSLDEGVRAALESHFPPAADTLPPDVVAKARKDRPPHSPSSRWLTVTSGLLLALPLIGRVF